MADPRTQFNMPPAAEPLDAYRTLQLMPSADHDLIEQAYWVLVGRTRAQGSHSARLGRLNDAYATLINGDRRQAYDLEHGLTKLRSRPKFEMPRRPMFGRTPKFTTRLTHYQVLDIDFEALPEVVDTAYVFHKAQLRRSDPGSVYMRALIEDAYETLSHPHRRAQYDDKVAPRKLPVAEAVAPVVAPPPPREPAPLFPDVAEPVAEPAAERVEAPVAEPTPEPAAAPVAEPTPVPAAVVATPAVETGAEKRKGIRGWLHGRAQSTPAAPEPKSEHRSQRTLRTEARLDVLEAEHKRLVDLGLLGDRPAQSTPEDSGPPPRAQFRFTSGPQAGESIGLAENSLILGASEAADVMLSNPDGTIGAGHVRVWRRDGEYILHQLDSFSTTYVNGERLDLRLAILESGDEIRIGTHTLIFDQAPEPPAE